MPWEVLAAVFSAGAAIGGILGHAVGKEKGQDYQIARERSGIAGYFREHPASHDHEH